MRERLCLAFKEKVTHFSRYGFFEKVLRRRGRIAPKGGPSGDRVTSRRAAPAEKAQKRWIENLQEEMWKDVKDIEVRMKD